MKVTNHSPSLSIKLVGAIFSLALLAMVSGKPVNAQENIPAFGGCPTPGGQVVAAYPEGWHWIVGYNDLQWGADTVFALGNNNFTQCFCPLSHEGQVSDIRTGIQSNWIYTADLTNYHKFLRKNI